MIRPTLQSHNVKDLELVLYGLRILNKMSENLDVFVSPTPSLQQLDEVLEEFQKAITAARFRDMRAIVVRKQKKAELLNVIRLLSYYVARVANGDPVIILSAGFIPSKKRGASKKNTRPMDFRATPSIGSGSVKLRIKSWRFALMYRFEYRKAKTNDNWIVLLTSKSTCTISDLEVFEEYEFRVSYVLRSAQTIYSEMIRCMIY